LNLNFIAVSMVGYVERCSVHVGAAWHRVPSSVVFGITIVPSVPIFQIRPNFLEILDLTVIPVMPILLDLHVSSVFSIFPGSTALPVLPPPGRESGI